MFNCFYNACVLSMLISVVLFQNAWLEMRVNLGHVFFVLAVVLFAFQVLVKPLRKFCAEFKASVLCLAISSVGVWCMLGFERLQIIPASIIREGIMQHNLSFSAINTALIICAVTGLILAYLLRRR